jgi:hypothetical protein
MKGIWYRCWRGLLRENEMVRGLRLAATGLAGCLLGNIATAHTMWIGLAPDIPEQQVVVNVAYGDYLPGSELLSTEWGRMRLAKYEVIAPDGVRANLGVPEIAAGRRSALPGGVQLSVGGDTGQRKLALADGARGTYQIAAESPVFRYVHYRDKAGAEHYYDGPEAGLKNLAEVLDVSHEVFYLKSAFTAGGWTDVTAAKQLLEIVPVTDLHGARPGTLVRLRVLLRGKPWDTERGPALVTAQNQAFGDRWGLSSALSNGIAEFRVPTAGLWRFDVRHDTLASSFPELVPSAKAGELLVINASFTIHVRP